MISYYSFAMGHHDLREKKFVLKARRIVIHASYNSNGRSIDDIAFIELNQTVDFKNDQLGFICLPYNHINDNDTYPPIGTETYVIMMIKNKPQLILII
jgi:predicted metalloenzyme YecM